MKINSTRFVPALKAMTVHFGLSLLVAGIVALLVFTLWFPYPYRELAGGRELFILVMAVDIVCGPLLTFVLFSPTKPKKELITDISLIAVIQILALCYGIWTVWQVRPIFLVQEADRFNIIAAVNIEQDDLELLPNDLKPGIFKGPINVSLRNISPDEREKLNTQIKSGGKDASARPYFYTKYQGENAYRNGRTLRELYISQPEKASEISTLIRKLNVNDETNIRYLYVVGRQYWIVIINKSGDILKYIEIQ